MSPSPSLFDRREFLRRGALLIPALHAGLGLGLGSTALAEDRGRAADTENATDPQAVAHPARFRKLELRSHRLEEQYRFYRETLGLETRLDGSAVVVHTGKTELRFVPAEEGTGSHADRPAPMYHFAFMIPENKIEKAIEWMDGRAPLQPHPNGGVVFHFRRWNAHSIYFFDPAGHLAEFIAHHELPTAAAGAFSPADILSTCEIGLVAPKIEGLVEQLDAHLDLQPLFGGSPTFAAVGDRNGLFICVPEHRIWLASDLEARTHPVEATIRGPRKAIFEPEDLPFRVSAEV